jgi:hypothetical protein
VGATRVQLRNAPLDDVQLTMGPAGRVSGRIVFDGRSSPLHGPTPLRVREYPAGFVDAGYREIDPRGVADHEGNFELDGLLGDLCFGLEGIPLDWSLESISLDGRDYTKRPVRFERGREVTGLIVRVVPGPLHDSIGAGDRGPCTPARRLSTRDEGPP